VRDSPASESKFLQCVSACTCLDSIRLVWELARPSFVTEWKLRNSNLRLALLPENMLSFHRSFEVDSTEKTTMGSAFKASGTVV
jgi:hypothetical protein